MNQDISSNHHVEWLDTGKGPDRGLFEVDVPELGRPCSSPGHGDGFLAAIDPNDRPGCADQLGGEHRDVAGAAAQVEDPHAPANPRARRRRSVIGRRMAAWCISRRISRSECPRMYSVSGLSLAVLAMLWTPLSDHRRTVPPRSLQRGPRPSELHLGVQPGERASSRLCLAQRPTSSSRSLTSSINLASPSCASSTGMRADGSSHSSSRDSPMSLRIGRSLSGASQGI